MTLAMKLQYRNPDRSSDVNLRFKDVFAKGFLTPDSESVTPDFSPFTGELTSVGLLVTVAPFILVNYDGAVVISDANVDVDISSFAAATPIYVTCRAKYVALGSPILAVEANTIPPSGQSDPDWVHLLGVVEHNGVSVTSTSYAERDVVDQQGRGSFRAPVANSGLLPFDYNVDGDIRLTLDTRSFYTWDSGTSSWQLIDEVSITTHRREEHSNGLIAASDPAVDLLPTATVGFTTMSVGGTAGSGAFTIDGARYTYAGDTKLLSAVPGYAVGSIGLVQAWLDNVGPTLQAEYRVEIPTPTLALLSYEIWNISDEHAVGAGTIGSPAPGFLQWFNGVPVDVSALGTFRLHGSDGVSWVDINVTSAPGGGGSDVVNVAALRQSETEFLIAYFPQTITGFISGSMPVVDRRLFGNVDWAEMSSKFKDKVFYPYMNEFRGTCVYSGGDCDNAGSVLQVSGPIVAYIEGRRYEVPTNFVPGFPVAGTQTYYLYVDADGALQFTTTAPTGVYATVAEVAVVGGLISSITDTRDPQLIVGQATRDAKLVMSRIAQLRWNAPAVRLYTDNLGTTVATSIETGRLVVADNIVEGKTGALSFVDTNALSPQALTTATENDLASVQPLRTVPSVFGALGDGQKAQRGGLGVISGMTVSFVGANVTFAAGSFIDWQGHVVETAGSVSHTMTGAAGLYVVAWNGSTFTQTLLSTGVEWNTDLPFAIVDFDGVNITSPSSYDISIVANGQRPTSEYVIGNRVSGSYVRANFRKLKTAMLFAGCFKHSGGNTAYSPRSFVLIDHTSNSSSDLIDFSSLPFSAMTDRLNAFRLEGRLSNNTSTSLIYPRLAWDSTTSPFMNLADAVNGVSIENVRFAYQGTGGVGNDLCHLKSPGIGLQVNNVVFTQISGTDWTNHVVYFTGTSLGGDTASQMPPTTFRNVNIVLGKAEAAFYFDAAVTGELQMINSTVESTVLGASLVEMTNAAATAVVGIQGGGLTNLSLLFDAAPSNNVVHTVAATTLKGIAQVCSAEAGHRVVIRDSLIDASGSYTTLNTTGCSLMSGCSTPDSAATIIVESVPSTSFDSCQIYTSSPGVSRFDGSSGWSDINNCKLSVNLDGEALTATGPNYSTIRASLIEKNNVVAGHNLVLFASTAGVTARDTEFSAQGVVVDTSSLFQVAAAASLKLDNCRVQLAANRSFNKLFFVEGELTLANTSIEAQSSNVTSTFISVEAGGTATITSSTLEKTTSGAQDPGLLRVADTAKLTASNSALRHLGGTASVSPAIYCDSTSEAHLISCTIDTSVSSSVIPVYGNNVESGFQLYMDDVYIKASAGVNAVNLVHSGANGGSVRLSDVVCDEGTISINSVSGSFTSVILENVRCYSVNSIGASMTLSDATRLLIDGVELVKTGVTGNVAIAIDDCENVRIVGSTLRLSGVDGQVVIDCDNCQNVVIDGNTLQASWSAPIASQAVGIQTTNTSNRIVGVVSNNTIRSFGSSPIAPGVYSNIRCDVQVDTSTVTVTGNVLSSGTTTTTLHISSLEVDLNSLNNNAAVISSNSLGGNTTLAGVASPGASIVVPVTITDLNALKTW
jgi:hypothetical protein